MTGPMEAGMAEGVELVGALMDEAAAGVDALRVAVGMLSADQARWALFVMAMWDASRASAGGVHHVVDDQALDKLRASCEDGPAAVASAIRTLNDPQTRAALANLVHLHVELRREALASGLN